MRQVFLHGEFDIRVAETRNPELIRGAEASGLDAIVRVVAACVCGSDLWRYRGIEPTIRPPRPMGHEFIGVVEEVGDAVRSVRPGDFVIAPFYICDGECVNCRNGVTQHCQNGGSWGAKLEGHGYANGGQSERVRVPLADGTLFPIEGTPDESQLPGLLTLSDVMGTGYHAAISAGVGAGSTVAVIGDGAVGLCAIIAAKLLGASRIVAMSRHADRQALATEFGATDIVPERGDTGIAIVKDMFDGIGPDCVLECVGAAEPLNDAIRLARPGGQVGFVGVPGGESAVSTRTLFDTNVGVRGGIAPARGYMAQLLPLVLDGTINPGRVFDLTLPLDDAAEAYAAMDERRAIKVMLRP